MKPSLVILSVLAALAAATPIPQCAGCEPSGKGASGATSNSNATNTNTNEANASNSNSNDVNVSVGSPSAGGGSGGGNNSGGTDGEGETKGSCKACIDFCTGRADLLDALCKVVVCGVDCVVV